MPRITFYYDCISPWSYFAHVLLKRYREPWQLDLILKPRYLGGVMVASGNKPPATVLTKGAYMREFDLPLTSAYYGIPYKYPSEFPVNTIHIARFLRVAEDEAPAKLDALTDIFFEAMWGLSADAIESAKPSAFPSLIPHDVLSCDEVQKFTALSQTAENKERMKFEATELVAQGCFGFPFMQVVNDEGEKINIFGSDRFEILADLLKKKYLGPFPQGGRPAKL